MPIQFDKFEQTKVDNLKNHLVSMASKGQAKFYEIFIDNLKAVQKTDEPSEFEGYEDYMSPDSATLKIVIYNTGSSPRNDQFVFLLKAQSREDAVEIGLAGMPVKTFSFKDIGEWRQGHQKKSAERLEIMNLKREITELKGILGEKEEEIEKLAEAVFEAKENGNKIGGLDLGDIGSHIVEGLIRRNTHLLAKVPMLEGLAGIIDQDSKRSIPAAPQQETEVSFKKKEPTEVSVPQLTEPEKIMLDLVKVLAAKFNESQFGQVIEILEYLSEDKNQVPLILELLQDNRADVDEQVNS